MGRIFRGRLARLPPVCPLDREDQLAARLAGLLHLEGFAELRERKHSIDRRLGQLASKGGVVPARCPPGRFGPRSRNLALRIGRVGTAPRSAMKVLVSGASGMLEQGSAPEVSRRVR